MAVSAYDKQFLTQEQQDKIAAITAEGEKTGDWASAHAAAEAIRNSAGYTGGTNGSGYATYSVANEEDTSKANEELLNYLKQMQAANTSANLANLASAYQTNKNNLEAQQAELPETYAQSRNDAAAQDAISRKNFDERAVANGLSNGASGQAELSRESAYKNNIAAINSSEAQANNDIELQLNNLQAEYENAIAQAKAEGDSELATSLYNELVRQTEAAQEERATAASNALSEAKYAQSLAVDLGITDPSTIAGITSLSDLAKLTSSKSSSSSSTSSGSNTSSGTSTDTTSTLGYDNGSLTASEVKQLQNYYGVTADGLWGTNSQTAAGGLTADEAWAKYKANYYTTRDTQSTNYNEVAAKANEILASQGRNAAMSYVREAYTTGAIDLSSYSKIYNTIRGNTSDDTTSTSTGNAKNTRFYNQ